MQFSHWNDIIDLNRYPIEDLTTSKAQTLLQQCRAQLADAGAVEMEGFVRSAALKILVQEGAALEKSAYRNALIGNAYLDAGDKTLPAGHARNLTEKTELGAVAYDEFPKESLLRRIYEWKPVMLFIGAILGLKNIYPYNDPMSALNLSVMIDGDYLRWHFDESDFVTSLSVRNADEGGIFEYVPRVRSASQPNFEKIAKVIHGGRDGVVVLPNKPGSLVLFQGKYSLHRVTPIKGKTSRLMGLFAYSENQESSGSDYLRQIRYGRTKAKV